MGNGPGSYDGREAPLHALVQDMTSSSIRSTFVFWSQALREPERLLDDLSAFTKVNTIELGFTYSTSGVAGGTVPAGEEQRAVISSSKGFGDLHIPVASASELGRMHEFISLAESRGFKVACNFPSPLIATRDRLSMACLNIRGKRVDPPLSPPQPIVKPAGVYGCPNNPDVIAYSEEMMRQIAKTWAPAEIITLNHVEWPLWPGRKGIGFLLEDLLSCFCPHCERRARDEGIDFEAMKRSVSSLDRAISTPRRGASLPGTSPDYILNWLAKTPALATWLAFRLSSMTRYIKEVVEAGREAAKEHNPKLQIGLEFQIPSLSNLLGTDFVELYPYFDFMVPKFPDYLTANTLPIVAETISTRTGVASAEAVNRFVSAILDLGPGPKKLVLRRDPVNMLYDVPYDLSIIERQMKYLSPLLGNVPLHPYIWLEEGDAHLLGEKIQTLEENGLHGYFIWQWEQDLTHEALKARRGIY